MQVPLVALSDVADGAARLRLAQDGSPLNPLVVTDLRGLGGASPELVETAATELARNSGVVVAMTDRATPLRLVEVLTARVEEDDLDAVLAAVTAAPLAAIALDGLLGLTSTLDVVSGLVAESATYSMLLQGPEFLAWRAREPRVGSRPAGGGAVLVERRDDVLHVSLNRPERHNAFSHEVRDALLEAFELARLDDSVRQVTLTGAGPSFCSGGDLDEFGTAPDPVTAYLVRLRRSPGHLVYDLRDRIRPVLHGACVGAGVEIPAFAAHVIARRDAWMALPELSMGLVPGAGGTVSLPRRIGRHRTAWLALTGRRIDAATALAWGLVDELAD